MLTNSDALKMTIVVILTPLVLLFFRKIAIRFKLLDMPNARKIHANAVPLVGGVAIFFVGVLAMFLTKNISNFHLVLVVAAGFVLVIGLIDDLFDLSAMLRFMVQIMASLVIIIYSHTQLHSFGFLLLPHVEISLWYFSIPVTLFGVVGVINALNMSDGIDGLAALTFFFPVSAFVLMSDASDFISWLTLLLISIIIFIFFNKSKKYKVFLGDNGSMFLGFILAWLLVYFSQGEPAIIKPVTALYLVALPIFDTIFVMLRRIAKRLSPFKPDKTHFHHLFLDKGFSQTQTLFSIVFLQLIFIVLGIVLLKAGVAEYLQFYLFVALSIIYYKLMAYLWFSTTAVFD